MINKNSVAILIYTIALLKTSLFSLFGFGLLDEGESLHNAQRILAGDLPYKNFFAVFPPLHHYLYVFLFKFFGQSVLIPRLISSILFSFVPVLIFIISRKYVSIKYALLPAFLIIFLDVNIERLYYFAPILLGLYIFQSSLDKLDKKGVFFSGLFIGISALSRFDIPGALGVAMVFGTALHFYYLNKSKWFKSWINISALLFIGSMISIGPVIIWLVNKNIFQFFLNDTILKAIYITKLHHLPFPSPIDIIPWVISLSSLANSYLAIFGYFILATYLITVIFFARKVQKLWIEVPIVGILLLCGILALPYIFGRSDMSHLIKGGVPALFLASYLLYKFRQNRFVLIKLILWGLVGTIFLASFAESLWWINFNNQKIIIGNNTLRLNSGYIKNSTVESASTLKDTVNFLTSNTTLEEPVLILPYMAGLYFLSNRKSGTQYDNVLAGFVENDLQEREFINSIEAKHVKVVVYARDSGPKMKTPLLKEYNPLIDQYIMEHYQTVKITEEGWLFMRKKDVR